MLNSRRRVGVFGVAVLVLASCIGAGGVKTWKGNTPREDAPVPHKTPFEATPEPRLVDVEQADANKSGSYWTNLLGSWSRQKRLWDEAQTWRTAQSVLEREADYAVTKGFGSWGLFEFGPHEVRHAESGWNRPIHQWSTQSAMRRRAMKGAISYAKGRGLSVYGYIGTLSPDGEDVIPAAIDMYLDELTLMADAGFDRMYLDASAWNSPLTNAERPVGVGGGARRDGVMAIRRELERRGIEMEIGVEAWPNDEGILVREAAPALITGQFASTRYRQRTLGFATAAGDTNFCVVIFNMHQDGKDPESLKGIAGYGYAFDAGGKERGLIELVHELNSIAKEARREGRALD